jgi:hypothetical protein
MPRFRGKPIPQPIPPPHAIPHRFRGHREAQQDAQGAYQSNGQHAGRSFTTAERLARYPTRQHCSTPPLGSQVGLLAQLVYQQLPAHENAQEAGQVQSQVSPQEPWLHCVLSQVGHPGQVHAVRQVHCSPNTVPSSAGEVAVWNVSTASCSRFSRSLRTVTSCGWGAGAPDRCREEGKRDSGSPPYRDAFHEPVRIAFPRPVLRRTLPFTGTMNPGLAPTRPARGRTRARQA